MTHECIEESPAKANEADVIDMKTGELQSGKLRHDLPLKDASTVNFDANQRSR